MLMNMKITLVGIFIFISRDAELSQARKQLSTKKGFITSGPGKWSCNTTSGLSQIQRWKSPTQKPVGVLNIHAISCELKPVRLSKILSEI